MYEGYKMGFEDLWEKYGEKREKDMPSEVHIENETPVLEYTNQTTYRTKDETVGNKTVEPKPTLQEEKQISDRGKQTSVGVFGDEKDVTVADSTKHNVKSANGLDFSGMKDWPWLDIIFVIITLSMIVGVIVNFEKVTTAIFNMLLPLLGNILALIIVIGLIGALIWWFTRRIRRPRRRW
jgi:flagellar biosynthesis protein FliQ